MNYCYYFAYGMNTDPGAMALRTGQPTAVGAATLKDYRFRFAVHADVYPHPGGAVDGVLWLLNEDQLRQLDQREGYPHYYDRSIVEVEADGQVYNAWVYWMTPGHPTSPPSEGYLDMLCRGYGHFGVRQDQIELALLESEAAEEADIAASGGALFDSWVDAITYSHGRTAVRKIAGEAAAMAMSPEELCRDYVLWGDLQVPKNIRVRGDHL